MPRKSAKKRVVVVPESESDSEDQTIQQNENKRQKTSDTTDVAKELSPDAGVLIVGGGTNWNVMGRKEAPKGVKVKKGVNVDNLWGPHVWRENIRVKAVASSCTAFHSVLITEDGSVFTWGRNENGQLGLGDMNTRYEPTLVEALEGENIVQAATGRGHTLFVNDKGAVFSCGSNQRGQLGLGKEGKDKSTPEKIKYSGKPIVKSACGAEFSMIVDTAGRLYSFGHPEYGQLGHNTIGSRMERAGKFTYDYEASPRMISQFFDKDDGMTRELSEVIITDIKCGVNHSIASDNKGRVFTWGFGGYGRLGHTTNKDELMPRQVKVLENFKVQPTAIAAGSTFCFVSSAATKLTYFWGQQKNSGAGTMYPKFMEDLNGWDVKTISCCNKSVVMVADDSVISWGPSPTYGELLYGDSMTQKKTFGKNEVGQVNSSTVPKEVKTMTGIHPFIISCGYGHTLMVVKDLTEEQRKRLSELPKWPASR